MSRREVRGPKANRTIRGMTRELIDVLAAEASSRSITVNTLVLQVLGAFVEQRDPSGSGAAWELDPAKLYQRYPSDPVAVRLALEVRRLIQWLGVAEKGRRLPAEAEDWAAEQDEREAAEREQRWADGESAQGERDEYAQGRAYRVDGRVVCGVQDGGVAFPSRGGWIPRGAVLGLMGWLEGLTAGAMPERADGNGHRGGKETGR